MESRNLSPGKGWYEVDSFPFTNTSVINSAALTGEYGYVYKGYISNFVVSDDDPTMEPELFMLFGNDGVFSKANYCSSLIWQSAAAKNPTTERDNSGNLAPEIMLLDGGIHFQLGTPNYAQGMEFTIHQTPAGLMSVLWEILITDRAGNIARIEGFGGCKDIDLDSLQIQLSKPSSKMSGYFELYEADQGNTNQVTGD